MFNPLAWIAALLRGLTALAGVADTVLTAWQRHQDRAAGRTAQRADDLETTSRILEGQRDEASKPAADPGALLECMRRNER